MTRWGLTSDRRTPAHYNPVSVLALKVNLSRQMCTSKRRWIFLINKSRTEENVCVSPINPIFDVILFLPVYSRDTGT